MSEMLREPAWVPAAVWALAMLVLVAPVWGTVGKVNGRASASLALCVAGTAMAAWSSSGTVAFGAMALVSLVQAAEAWTVSRTAAITLALSAAAAVLAGVGLTDGATIPVFIASVVAVVLRAGLVPLHVGVGELCERSPRLQTQQFATTVVLVFVHLRFADGIPYAWEVAPTLVRYGAIMTLLPGVLALVQRDLRGFYRLATVMHGGMIVAALGASGRGHSAAALMVIITTAFAMGGLGMMVQALEARVGEVPLPGPGGRVQALPRLAGAFVLFGAAGVAMPGTSGFIADDLMLHALWGESVASTVMIILGAAALAIATLATFAKVFLGPPSPTLAPDLLARERHAATVLLVVLLVLGIVPGLLLTPADAFLGIADQ